MVMYAEVRVTGVRGIGLVEITEEWMRTHVQSGRSLKVVALFLLQTLIAIYNMISSIA